jgi:hypothetical protein
MRDETTIGTSADIPAAGFLVKPVQAKIIRSAAGHKVIALGGWRAVKINGAKVTGERELKPNDIIVVAGATMTYRPA